MGLRPLAVSYVKPDGWLNGHPSWSKLELFEGFVKKIVNLVKGNHDLWEHGNPGHLRRGRRLLGFRVRNNCLPALGPAHSGPQLFAGMVYSGLQKPGISPSKSLID